MSKLRSNISILSMIVNSYKYRKYVPYKGVVDLMDNIGKFGIKRINAMISRRTSRERRERESE